MKKHSYFFIYLCFIVLITTSQSCIHITPPPEADSCSHRGITYKIDGTLYSFDDENVTAEIRHDAAIGKFYDIWSDDNVNGQNGFYFHSTVTETGEQAPYAPDWFTTDDVGNIAFLNQKTGVQITFKVIKGANAPGQPVEIDFSGTFEENGTTRHITDGKICTDIDTVD